MPEACHHPSHSSLALQLTATGINTLFGKLRQGVQEDQQVLTIARLRADAEDQYATSLESIQTATSRIDAGFQRDEGASTKKVRGIHA